MELEEALAKIKELETQVSKTADDLATEKKESSKWESRSKENFKNLEALEKKITAAEPKEPKEKEVTEKNEATSALEVKLAELEKKLADKELADARHAVATKHKLPAYLANRLQGKDSDELEADAKALAEAYAGEVKKPAAKPNNYQGFTGKPTTASGTIKTKEELLARLSEVKSKD